MRDEKRQTRLLPFRLRRAGGPGAARRRDAAEDPSADAELSEILRAWEAPRPAASARARLLADFRATTTRTPLWRRALASGVRVPLPVAACALLAFGVSLYALGARTRPATPAAAEAAPVVRYVEVPVVQERVVTRVVYVDRKERRVGEGALAQTGAEKSVGARRARKHEERPAGGGDAQTNYYTRVDMADFKPADDMKIRIVNRGKSDEK